MGDVSYIAAKPLPRISPEQACDARARAWAFVFQCWQEKQKGGPETAPDDAKELERRRLCQMKMTQT
jgi:hypothetical protein